ncbi:hypothetical protein [Paracoccus sp. KR1-242]
MAHFTNEPKGAEPFTLALRVALLMHRYGLDADRAAMLAALILGGGHAH